MMRAADLHEQVTDQLDAIRAIRRTATELLHTYARLDADKLAVDELGDPADPADTLAAARAALVDLDRALGLATDATYAAMRHTSRLYERTDVETDDKRPTGA